LDPEAEMLADLGEGIDEAELIERILMRISVWVEEYTQLFFEKPWSTESGSYEDSSFIRWAEKLWNVWKYHWESAQKTAKRNKIDIDLFEVAEMVHLETGYTGEGKLGGNPFRDILLVDAINQGEQLAFTFFYEDYLGLAMKIKLTEDCWHDFYVSHVIDRKGESGLPAIANYDGKAGLARWVDKSAIRFHSNQVRRFRRKQGNSITPSEKLEILLSLCTGEQIRAYEEYYEINSPDRKKLIAIKIRLEWLTQQVTQEQKLKYHKILGELTANQQYQDHQESSQSNSSEESSAPTDDKRNECLAMLGRIVLNLINSFSVKDTLIFKLQLLDGLKQEEIGRIVGKDKGQISRDLKRMKLELLKKLASYTPEAPGKKEKYEQCLELLTLPAFFEELASWLKEENNASQDEERNEQ
tara:strand:+ start:1949 stop:3187 length:1239 start_codon:yes stop_codon:yes gene_type:complete